MDFIDLLHSCKREKLTFDFRCVRKFFSRIFSPKCHIDILELCYIKQTNNHQPKKPSKKTSSEKPKKISHTTNP